MNIDTKFEIGGVVWVMDIRSPKARRCPEKHTKGGKCGKCGGTLWVKAPSVKRAVTARIIRIYTDTYYQVIDGREEILTGIHYDVEIGEYEDEKGNYYGRNVMSKMPECVLYGNKQEFDNRGAGGEEE